MTDEGLLGGQIEPAGTGTAGDDKGAGVDDLLAYVEDEGGFREIDGGEMGHAQFGAEAGGLLLHVLNEFWPLDAFGPAGEVFHQGGDGELAAGLVAFEDEGFEIGAGGVDGGGEASAAGAKDDGIAHVGGGDGFAHNFVLFDCKCVGLDSIALEAPTTSERFVLLAGVAVLDVAMLVLPGTFSTGLR